MSCVIGIGCRRGTSEEEIASAVVGLLEGAGLSLADIDCIASCDVKADETGLIDYAAKNSKRLLFYAAEDLAGLHTPNPSERVRSHVGTPSVCEAAAMMASDGGPLIAEKTVRGNVALSLARRAGK